MGNEERARAEYAVAIQKAVSKIQKVVWSLQVATTYVREGNDSAADEAFQAVARQAHENDLGNIEAEAYRQISLYQKDSAAAMKTLERAEAALHENHQVPKSLADRITASILKTRIERAVSDGNLDLAAASLRKLEAMSNASSDAAVQLSFAASAGAVAVAQGKYQEAISELEDADRDPFAMQHLVVAYEKTGQKENAAKITGNLAGFNEPLMEQAVVVLPFRKALKEQGTVQATAAK